MKAAIVTATLDLERATACVQTWVRAWQSPSLYVVYQGEGRRDGTWRLDDRGSYVIKGYAAPEILGTVPAFAIGVQKALEDGAEIIACLHDDVEIYDYRAGELIDKFFLEVPKCGLVGFGGGTGLGDDDLYEKPYNPMSLARKDFISNMKDAEAHGRRVLVPTKVACLDGFSQIGRREFWTGAPVGGYAYKDGVVGHQYYGADNLFSRMQGWGVIHHFYDGMLGCFAKRLGWEVWMLPIACHHLGGQTAVGDPRYTQWANRYASELARTDARRDEPVPTGDQMFWQRAHAIGYEQFRDILPIRVS